MNKLLFIDARIPAIDEDSGSIDAYNYMRCLIDSGYAITFLAYIYRDRFLVHAKKLMDLGVEVLNHPFNDLNALDQWVFSHGNDYQAIVICRPEIGQRLILTNRQWCPNAMLIYSTVDLHHLRLAREAQILGDDNKLRDAERMKNIELKIFGNCDKIVVVSETERGYLSSLGFSKKIWLWPLLREIKGRARGYVGRNDILFIGGFSHTPNVDGLKWFLEEVWPRVTQKDISIRFHIVGSEMPSWVSDLKSANIVPHGFVADLDELFGDIRLTVAPLRYGAGLKGKIITSLSYGVPVVATNIGTEGMPGSGDGIKHGVVEANDGETFAARIVELYSNPSSWNAQSIAGLKTVSKHFGFSAVRDRIRRDLIACKIESIDKIKLDNYFAAIHAEYDDESNSTGGYRWESNSFKLIELLVDLAKGISAECGISLTELFVYGEESYKHWFYDTAISQLACDSGDWHSALFYAERSLAKNHFDLYTQHLWLTIKEQYINDKSYKSYSKYLSTRYCDRPFHWLEITKGSSWSCCSSWLPVPIGDGKDLKNDLASDMRNTIQQSILQGKFDYCSKMYCPWIAGKKLADGKQESRQEDSIDVINLCYDESCSLRCPTCRSETICASNTERKRLGAYYDDQVLPFINQGVAVNITGSGDPFYSRHFRDVLRNVANGDLVKLDLQTNGVLADREIVEDLGIKSIRRVWISLDATTEDVYDTVRVGGNFFRALTNIINLSSRRKKYSLEFIGLDFVVQAKNLDQMIDFIHLGKTLNVDKVRFNMIRNWGTFDSEEFLTECPGFLMSPLRSQFEKIMAEPIFLDSLVDLGNLPIFLDHNKLAPMPNAGESPSHA